MTKGAFLVLIHGTQIKVIVIVIISDVIIVDCGLVIILLVSCLNLRDHQRKQKV